MKKGILYLFIGILALSLVSCGEPVDHYMEGYDAVDEGRYEDALISFQKAAEEGDQQAATAAEIITGYFHARDAYQLGDMTSAKAFLEELPENYKYYAIGEDIDALRRKIYAGILPEGVKSPEEPEVSKTPDMDQVLSQAEELIAQGNLDEAFSLLENLPEGSLNRKQMQWVVRLHADITQKQEEHQEQETPPTKTPETEADQSLSPEKAAEYLKVAYPEVEGDIGGALLPQYDENNNLYYTITIQVKEGEIKTVHILPDGAVRTAK